MTSIYIYIFLSTNLTNINNKNFMEEIKRFFLFSVLLIYFFFKNAMQQVFLDF